MSCLLFLFTEVGENVTTIVTIVAIVLLCALLVTAILLTLKRAISTREIVFAGICLASSFVLSYIKFVPVTYGGSITLASMLPICIFAYVFGLAPALLTGLIYGLLQFIQNPYIFNYATFFLDFLLAFSSISMMSVSKMIFKDKKYTPIIGLSFVYLVRFLFHFLSGLIYFDNGGIWANLPQDNALIYSFLYQITYLAPDFAINLAVLIPLCATSKFTTLTNFMKK